MASGLFTQAKVQFLSSNPSHDSPNTIDLDADTIKVRLINVSTDYTSFNAANTTMTPVVKYLNTTDQTLGSVTTTAGVFDANDVTFTAVAADGSKTVAAIAIFKYVTSDALSFPIAYIDGFTAVLPNTGNITVQWDNGANKIFAL